MPWLFPGLTRRPKSWRAPSLHVQAWTRALWRRQRLYSVMANAVHADRRLPPILPAISFKSKPISVIDLSINNAIGSSKRGKIGTAYTSSQPRLRSPDAGEVRAEVAEELALGVGATVGQGVLRKLPDSLVGVELGRVAGEAVEMEPGVAVLERADGVAAVDRAVVPDHHHGAAEMAEQIPEKGADLGVLDVLGREEKVEAIAAAAGTDREAGDDRDALAPLAVTQEWGLAARRPGATHARDQEEPRLVDEDDVGAQPRGFFLMCGHVSRFQCSILSSLRSSARRSGFCTLQPRLCSSRPTCAR